MIADLHNHYLRAGEVDAMVEAAARAGVAEVAITEHVFHLTEAREASTYLRTRFVPEGTPLPHAEYVAAVGAAAARASIPVRVGVGGRAVTHVLLEQRDEREQPEVHVAAQPEARQQDRERAAVVDRGR